MTTDLSIEQKRIEAKRMLAKQQFAASQAQSTIYREETGAAISAPSGMSGPAISYLDDVDNNNKEKQNYFGYTNLVAEAHDKLTDIALIPIKGIAASAIDMGTSGEAGVRLKMSDAIREGLEDGEDYSLFQEFFSRSPEKFARNRARRAVEKGDTKEIARLKAKADRLSNSVTSMRKNANDLIEKRFARPDQEDSILAERVLYDASGITTSIAASIGLTVVTKNPIAATSLFATTQESSIYLEARDADIGPAKARSKAKLAGMVEGSLEFIGISYFFKFAKNSGGVKGVMLRMAEEAIQEGSQTGAEEIITQTGGIRGKDVLGALQRVGYSMFLGSIGGGATSVMFDRLAKDTAKKEDIPLSLVENFMSKVATRSEEMIDILGGEMEAENSAIKSDKDQKNINQAMAMFENFVMGVDIDQSTLSDSDQRVLAAAQSERNAISAAAEAQIVEAQKEENKEFIDEAIKLKDQVEQIPDVNINNPQELKEILGYTPESITQFIRKNGGIKDTEGVLDSMDITTKSLVGLISNEKRSVAGQGGVTKQENEIDKIKVLLFDNGFFADKASAEDIENQDVYDAIENDLSGRKIYRQSDLDQISDFASSADLIDFDQRGITKGMSVNDIVNVLRAEKGLAEVEGSEAFGVKDSGALKGVKKAPEGETRGQGVFYHGTSSPIEQMAENIHDVGSEVNYYGQGFYTTDAIDIAKGYTKKGDGKEAVLYEVKEKNPVKFYNMEEDITPLMGELNKLSGEIIEEALEQMDNYNKFNLRNLYNEIRDSSDYLGLPAYEAQEVMAEIQDILMENGFGGVSHKGGLKTGSEAHEVRIYFDPFNQIEITQVQGGQEASKPDFTNLTIINIVGPETAEAMNDASQEASASFDAPPELGPIGSGARAVGKGLEKILTPISTRIYNINEKVMFALRRFEMDTKVSIQYDEKAILPFLKKWHKMNKSDRVNFDLALKNGNEEVISIFVEKYDMANEMDAVRGILDALHAKSVATGIDVNYKADFFPRHVHDVEGLLGYLRKSEGWSVFNTAFSAREKKLNRPLTVNERAEIANVMLRGFPVEGVSLSKRGIHKDRTIEQVTADINGFYETTDQALIRYVVVANESIYISKLFGRGVDLNGEENIEGSIGSYVDGLLEDGTISATKAKELKELFNARFNRGRMGPVAETFKDMGYLATMGSNIGSTVTQIGDLFLSAFKNNLIPSLQALPRSLTNKTVISLEEIGIIKIAQEMESKTVTSKVVETAFNLTGLTFVDRLGKRTLVQGSYNKNRKLAKKQNKLFVEKMEIMFGDKADQVMRDLVDGNITEDVKFIMFNDLLDMQPVALSEMPEQYLKSGNGKMFYMLKTFTIKQLDIYRRDVFRELRIAAQTKDVARAAKASSNFIRLLSYMMMAGATKDLIWSWMTGRDPDEPEDMVIKNLLKAFGLSKYTFDQMARPYLSDSPADALFSATIIPPTKTINNMWKDFKNLQSKEGLNIKDMRTLRSIPVGGELYYFWFGGGKNGGSKTKKKRSTNLG